MFDVNNAIDKWRKQLEGNGKINQDDIDELESHLRDEIDELSRKGSFNENDFENALVKIGDVFELSQEFTKVNNKKDEFIGIVQNGVFTMSTENKYSDRFIKRLFFAGFCGIIGWLGSTCWMLQGWTNSGHWATLGRAIGTIILFTLPFTILLVLALVCFAWGWKLLKTKEQKRKFILRPLIPAIILSPVYIFLGVMIFLTSPWWGGWAKAAVVGYKVVQSKVSPDGKYEAYVLDKPSFDGPNHHLYVRPANVNLAEEIAGLPEDVDSIKEIHWSLFSDIVVFESQYTMFVVRVPDYKMVKIPLGMEIIWRENGTIGISSKNVKRPEIIEFPEENKLSYQLEDSEELKTIDMDSL